ncbi:MAG: hypothetical protein IKZ05_03770 [Clostridia bacterium]|nr:hypothetical protein [Clostridia bacterium]
MLLWQSADISVSIVSETDEGNNDVTISILNTAGSTLLFYENDDVTGKIEYLSEDGWVEYCDVYYTASNTEAISSQYGGIFAELEPGEDWDLTVPKDKIADMKDGTYRIKMTYVTEKVYNRYLDEAFRNRNESVSEVIPEKTDKVSEVPTISGTKPISNKNTSELVPAEEEKFLGESVCEIFIKTFQYVAPEDYVDEISIEAKDIESNVKAGNKTKIQMFD